jgi:hypothetical protein
MQGNDSNTAVVTDKVKVFIWRLGLWVTKPEGNILNMFSRLKEFVEENRGDK